MTVVAPYPWSVDDPLVDAVDRAWEATEEEWPRLRDGTPITSNRHEKRSLADTFGVDLEVDLTIISLSDPHTVAYMAMETLREGPRSYESYWPMTAHRDLVGKLPRDGCVLAVADVARLPEALAEWRRAVALAPLPLLGRTRVEAALDAVERALPTPFGEPAEAILPELPDAPDNFDTEALAATMDALRRFCGANIYSHAAFGHGKSWEPNAEIEFGRSWSLSVSSYQFSEEARRASVKGSPSRIRAAAEELARATVAEAEAIRANPDADYVVDGIPTAAEITTDTDRVAAAPPAELLARALPAVGGWVRFEPNGGLMVGTRRFGAHYSIPAEGGRVEETLRRLLGIQQESKGRVERMAAE